MKNILLIEDEQNVSSFIKKGLEEENFSVYVVYDGQTGLEVLYQNLIDVIILDIILPGINGFEVCHNIRQKGYQEVPILMLTALGSTENVVRGLDMGADDYLVKPFKFKELLARVKALGRRKNLTIPVHRQIRISDLVLDLDAKMVSRAGLEIKLTSTEYRLLEYLLINQRRVVSRVDILENVWDINFDMGTNVVDVYINYLRNKIDKGFEPKLIQTVIGMGYVLKEG
jgi:DNA-binding response OmpR family regulator